MSAMTEGKNVYVLKAHCRAAIGTISRLTTFLANHHCYIMEMSQFDEVASGSFYVRCVFSTTPGRTQCLSHLKQEFQRQVAEVDGLEWDMFDTLATPKVTIMVSHYDHCLDDLLYRQRTGELKMDIVAIVSNHDTVKPIADAYRIPFHHLPVTVQTKTEQESQLMALVEDTQTELVILARYMQILSPALCQRLSGRAINIHHSFLPGFKGARPYHQAFDRGVKLIGATAHYVTSDLDEGPIIEQSVERVDHTYSPGQLAAVGRDAENITLARAVRFHLEHRVFVNGHKTVVFR